MFKKVDILNIWQKSTMPIGIVLFSYIPQRIDYFTWYAFCYKQTTFICLIGTKNLTGIDCAWTRLSKMVICVIIEKEQWFQIYWLTLIKTEISITTANIILKETVTNLSSISLSLYNNCEDNEIFISMLCSESLLQIWQVLSLKISSLPSQMAFSHF